MTLIFTTIVILYLLAANHAVHGFGCWGLQPGGVWSADLFLMQVLISIAALLWMGLRVMAGRDVGRFIAFGLGVAAAVGAIVEYTQTGWALFTSIHHQGAENLPTFLLASAVALIVGVYQWQLAIRYRPASMWRWLFNLAVVSSALLLVVSVVDRRGRWLIPYTAVLPAVWLGIAGRRTWRRERRGYRRRHGLCLTCGYDLRASVGAACPECGAAIGRVK